MPNRRTSVALEQARALLPGLESPGLPIAAYCRERGISSWAMYKAAREPEPNPRRRRPMIPRSQRWRSSRRSCPGTGRPRGRARPRPESHDRRQRGSAGDLGPPDAYSGAPLLHRRAPSTFTCTDKGAVREPQTVFGQQVESGRSRHTRPTWFGHTDWASGVEFTRGHVCVGPGLSSSIGASPELRCPVGTSSAREYDSE